MIGSSPPSGPPVPPIPPVPSPPPVASSPSTSFRTPSALSTIRVITPVMLRSVATGGRLLAMAALGAMGVLIAIIVRNSDDASGFVPAEFIGAFGLSILVPLVALVVASATLGNLIEQQTMVYLWLKPIPSWHVATSAVLAGLLIVLPLVVIPLVAVAAIVGDGADVTAALVASSLGAVGYVGTFTGLGLLTQRALAWGLAYILVWEGFIAGLSRGAGRFAIRSYTRSALAQISNAPDLIDRPYQISTAVIVAAGVLAVTLALTAWRLRSQEVA